VTRTHPARSRESNTRHAFSLDENRPDAVARRRKTKQRTRARTWISYAIPAALSNTAHWPSRRSAAAAA